VGAIRIVVRRDTRFTACSKRAIGIAFLAIPFLWYKSGCLLAACLRRSRALRAHDCYLVDSASSHMLVSKIKPCMSKYKQLYRETANGSLNQLSFI
jgi:hypothetical protein